MEGPETKVGFLRKLLKRGSTTFRSNISMGARTSPFRSKPKRRENACILLCGKTSTCLDLSMNGKGVHRSLTRSYPKIPKVGQVVRLRLRTYSDKSKDTSGMEETESFSG